MLGINPGSEQVRYTAERDGYIRHFNKFESTRIFTNACGPCIGQWDREGADKQEKIQLFIHLTEILQKEQTEIQTHMLL